MRRRFNLVPFDKTPAAVDLELGDKLRAEWPAILAWAVVGCAKWQQEGLGTAAAIEAETNNYFAESDHFGSWLSSHCELDETRQRYELATTLFASWSNYLVGINEPPETATRFGLRLRGLGLLKKKTSNIRWIGITLN